MEGKTIGPQKPSSVGQSFAAENCKLGNTGASLQQMDGLRRFGHYLFL